MLRSRVRAVKVLATGTEGTSAVCCRRSSRTAATTWSVSTRASMRHRFSNLTTGLEQIRQDIRRLTAGDLEGVDAVVHLAELSNDPLGDLLPRVTYDVNHLGSVRLATLAKATGIERFVYASSCSVYGVARKTSSLRTSPTNPQTAYAECKTLVERDVGALADDPSPQPSCALPLHTAPRRGCASTSCSTTCCGLAWTTREIKMESDGTSGDRSSTRWTCARRLPARSRLRGHACTRS